MFQQLEGRNDIKGLRLNDSVFLSKEEYSIINTAVIEAAEQELTLLNAFPIEVGPASKKKYFYTTLDEVGDADIVKRPADFPALTVNGTEAGVDIPLKGISFELDKDDIANSTRLGQKLDVLHARIAAKKVRKVQDEALYSKSSVYGTLGIEGQATGAFAGANWTTTTTNIYDQVRQILASVPAAYQQDRNTLILNNAQFTELFRDEWNNGTAIIQVTGGSFMAKIKATWPGLTIIQSQWVTAAEGILVPFRDDVARRVVTIPVQAIDWDENPMEIIMAAVGKDVLVVPTPSAVVKITGI